MAAQRVVVKHPYPFNYGDLPLMRGQVFTMSGSPNDAILLGRGYVMALEGKPETTKCGECGAEFIGHVELRGHGDRLHPVRSRTPEDEDRFLDRQDAMSEQLARAS